MDNRLVINVDGDALWYVANMANWDYSQLDATLRDYVRGYAGHGITDLVYGISGLASSVPSKVLTFYGDKADWKEEHGVPVDYSSVNRIINYRDMYATGTDCYGVMLDETKKQGMRAWISFRMNDCHDNDKVTSFLRGNLFYEALDGGMMLDCECIPPYFRKCLNYAYPHVRNTMLAYIDEQLKHFDADGIELDFVREPYCFDYINEKNAAAIMTEFIANVRALVDKCSARLGHKVLLSVRVLRDIEHGLVMGFDAAEWVRRGLVDVLVPTPRWASSDHALPVKAWKELVKGTDVEIWPGVEVLCNVSDSSSVLGFGALMQDSETTKAFAYNFLSEGADAVYLFNFYQTCFAPDKPVFKPVDVWEGCRSMEAAQRGIRRHIAGYEDVCPVNRTPFKPFPLSVNGEAHFYMPTGAIEQTDNVTILLGVSDGIKTITDVSMDGIPCAAVSVPVETFLARSMKRITNVEAIERSKTWVTPLCFSAKAGSGNTRDICVKAGSAVIKYAEIIVKHN